MSALDSLAARLGMRRSPSGMDAAGALPQPPQKPDRERLADLRERLERLEREHRAAGPGLPADDEPGMRYGLLDRIKPPAPDPLVFGPQYRPPGIRLPVVHCRACEAGWSVYGGARCWNCGRSA